MKIQGPHNTPHKPSAEVRFISEGGIEVVTLPVNGLPLQVNKDKVKGALLERVIKFLNENSGLFAREYVRGPSIKLPFIDSGGTSGSMLEMCFLKGRGEEKRLLMILERSGDVSADTVCIHFITCPKKITPDYVSALQERIGKILDESSYVLWQRASLRRQIDKNSMKKFLSSIGQN